MSGKLFHPGIIKLVRLYFLFIVLFFVFRLCFVGINHSASATELRNLLIGLFLTGIQFDSCISSYLLMIPALLLFLSGFLKRGQNLINRIIVFYLAVIGAVALFICAADIPYYHQFHSRITIAALSWMDNPLFVFKMVFGYAYNYIFLSVFILAIITFIFFVRRILSKSSIQIAPVINYKYALSYLVVFGLLIIGARGRLQRKSTINWGVAYFSVNPFANMAALNPVFTFATSFKDKSKQNAKGFYSMPEKLALNLVRGNLSGQNYVNDSTLTRSINPAHPKRALNVVLVIMESMSANKMGYFINGKHLTPFLDSLAQKSHFFTSCYSDGMHTFNGLYSTLTGNPALPLQQPLRKQLEALDKECLPAILKQNGYTNYFFLTHDEQFDYMNGFLKKNGFDEVIGQSYYPSEEVLGVTGVPDHVMFDLSLPYLNKIQSPFFATYLTGSDHQPYKFPFNTSFTSTQTNEHYKIVEYADWSLRHFFQKCKEQPWYSNTLFVLVADHGAIVDEDEDQYMALHHIPLLFYSPDTSIVKASLDNALSSQLDVFPSILGCLQLAYQNSSLGINLFEAHRSKLSFTLDADVIGIDSLYYYVEGKMSKGLFKINPNLKNCQTANDSIRLKGLQNYSNAVLQLVYKVQEEKSSVKPRR